YLPPRDWLLPMLAVLAYVDDGVWLIDAYDRHTGDGPHAYYYEHYFHNKFMMGIFIINSLIDGAVVIAIGYLKGYCQYGVSMEGVSMELTVRSLFHLMSRLEILLIVLIPIFTTHDVISTNSIAFFILYEFFAQSYNNQDLI
ncbi:unnamed protein product, partial [Didymodactylos carnosus]